MNKKALIAMSGGVDSSVAAYLSKENGFDCAGVTIKMFGNENACVETEKSCCSEANTVDARSVAYKLGMYYYVFNFTEDFKKAVIEHFVTAYETGLTPNPCIDCNRYIKFDKLLARAMELGYDYVATGHYARVEFDSDKGRYLLKKGIDGNKDQSYVLYSLTQEQLAHTLFPLGGMTKGEVRKIAEREGFVNAHKKESQDICFVPDGDYAGFIAKYTGKTYEKGNFTDKDGNILGEHKGIINYTIGQRRGLGLSLPEPLYVCDKCMDKNTVVLCGNNELFTKTVEADDFNFISCESFERPLRVAAKIRYRHPEQPATAYRTGANKVKVEFDVPQRAVTKGQAVVLYDGDTVIGGGTII